MWTVLFNLAVLWAAWCSNYSTKMYYNNQLAVWFSVSVKIKTSSAVVVW